MIRSTAHAAFGGSILDEILGGFYVTLRMGVFFPDMLTGVLTVMDGSVAIECATGCFNVLEQVIDLRLHAGMGQAGKKGDTQCQDNGEG